MRMPRGRTLAAGAAGIGIAGAAIGIGAAVVGRAAWNRLRMADIRGQVALITGGSRGLGFAIAHELAALGCKLVICARSNDELQRARTELTRAGADVLTIECDVGRQEQVESMVQNAIAHFGRLDILINNAGIIAVGPLESQTLDDFREAMDVMFWSNVYTTMAALPHMLERRGGRIVNVTSIGGKISVPHLVPYGCAKFAAVGFSEGITAELAKDNIKVTTVVPGLIRTGSYVNAFFKGDNRAEYSWFSLGATSPVTAIGARRAARSIVNAMRRGQAEIILSVPAKLAVWIHGLLPGTSITLAGVSNRLMPGTGSTDKHRLRGRQSENAVTRSFLTKLGRDAGKRLNQYPEHRPATGT